ncbi:hypothetical protein F4818DRAFT_438047 [Hypoxylon cercidicola]|nr:hypothetical protein F4818DRAFT_438047 [Hypoxylon cercidicola]
MGGVASIPTDPSRKVQVIAAGYSRTGTVSTSLALAKLLDGPGASRRHTDLGPGRRLWIKAYKARHAGDKEQTLKFVREATAGFVAIADLPPVDFMPEMMELYPDAKVVLVRRDPQNAAQFIKLGGPHILEAHNDKVRSLVPKEQLLEMELSEGWEPLCQFLGLPIPDEPFPRANDAKAADEYAIRVLSKVFQVWLGIFSAAGVAVYSGFWLWKHQMR